MSALDVPFTPSLETVIRHGAAVQAMTLAGFVVLLYDHILTFDFEVDLIWRAKAGLVSVIFLLNRYIVPLLLIVDLFEMFDLPTNSQTLCKVWTTIQSVFTIASFMSIHTIVAMRVYALYNGKRWVGRFLWVASVLYLVSSTAIIAMAHVNVIPDLQPEHHQCVGSIPSFLWAAWLPSIIFETILFILTLIAMIEHDNKRRSFNTLTVILYRDGMLYFVVVSLCSLFSLLVWAFADPTLLGLARYFALAIVNVAGSRLVLNLKSYSAEMKREEEWGSTMPHSDFGFASPPRNPPARDGSDNTSESSFDLEMYYVEREDQNIGERLR